MDGSQSRVLSAESKTRVACCVLRVPARSPRTTHHAPRTTSRASRFNDSTVQRFNAFTLLELMIVVAIMGLIMTLGVPMVYKIWHKAPMQQSIKDVVEVCSNARARAILHGQITEVVFHPRDRRLEVSGGGSGSGLSARLGDGVIIDLLDISMSGREFRDAEEARVKFYPTGTSDEMKMVLRYEAEQLGIELEFSTGLASVVPDPLRTWARR